MNDNLLFYRYSLWTAHRNEWTKTFWNERETAKQIAKPKIEEREKKKICRTKRDQFGSMLLWHYLVSIHLLVQFTATVHLCVDWIKMKSSRAKLVPNLPLARYCSQRKIQLYPSWWKICESVFILRVSVTHSHSNIVQQSLFLAIIIFSYPISSSSDSM